MAPLFGEYPCRLDDKGRLLMPATLAGLLPSNLTDYVLARGLDPCLLLYPRPVWDAELTRVYTTNQFQETNRAFGRLFQQGAQPVSLDKTRRLLIPRRLLEQAQMGLDLVLLGAYDKIEIWNEATYSQWLGTASAQRSQLAQAAMGSMTGPSSAPTFSHPS